MKRGKNSKKSELTMKLRSNEPQKIDHDGSVRLESSQMKPLLSESDDSDMENDKEYDKHYSPAEKSQNLKKDYGNIALLMFLYFLQGVPLGLTGSLPFILSSRKVSYADQGTFSFAFWPFSLKLLWAPIVDAVFIRKFGRRKSWLIPIQYLLGIFMLVFSGYIKDILETSHHNSHKGNFSCFRDRNVALTLTKK